MPELPEVETTRSGIEPHLLGRTVRDVVVRNPQLRWPVPAALRQHLVGCTVGRVGRRAKYLLLDCGRGHLIVHLGMTGTLRILPVGTPPAAHDHVDILLAPGAEIDPLLLRYRDPRRFGAVLWTSGPPARHPLLAGLGPEPLAEAFDADYLYQLARGRRAPVKTFIMDGRVVVGVGNIYANEALHLAGIHPGRAAGRISQARYRRLVEAIKTVLAGAIEQGGTTLRDFVGGEGRPGYFRQALQVYGRGGEPCLRCSRALAQTRIGQRSTVYCPACQR